MKKNEQIVMKKSEITENFQEWPEKNKTLWCQKEQDHIHNCPQIMQYLY